MLTFLLMAFQEIHFVPTSLKIRGKEEFVYFKEHLPIKGNMRNGGICLSFKEHLPINGNMRNGGVCTYFKVHLPIKGNMRNGGVCLLQRTLTH